jgi:tRNA G18 (ribose-2'-O)-methylase SpoU
MIAILANIRSLHNVGSIFRTADAAGIEKLYLAGITPAPTDQFGHLRPQLAKVSLGAEKTVAWEKCGSVTKLIDKLKNLPAGGGYKIWAVEQAPRSIPYFEVPPREISEVEPRKIALVIGNEVRGLSPALLKKCDKILEIPMRGKKESLNVAVAFGIVVFHLLYN